MNRELQKNQDFFTELEDPNIVAALGTLGFPISGGSAVELRDLGSLHRQQNGGRAWQVGQLSPTYGALAAAVRAWDQPLPSEPCANLHPAMVCKLALHNRRCLHVYLNHGGELFYKSLGAFGRLYNFPAAGVSKAAETTAPENFVCWDTAAAAAAITVGHALVGCCRDARGTGWLLIPGDPQKCVFALADVLGLLADTDALARREDPAALAVAALRNRDFLVRGADRAAKTKIYHKNGRYAVITGNAGNRIQVAAARHLNT